MQLLYQENALGVQDLLSRAFEQDIVLVIQYHPYHYSDNNVAHIHNEIDIT